MLSRASTQIANRASTATIVVVEDDPVMGRTLAKALETSGHRALIAPTAADARTLFGQVQPDLVILDLMLPDADGLSLTSSFRSLTNAPIIICSARHGQIDRVLSLRLGAADFVAKPFDLDEFAARVEAVLRQSRGSATVEAFSECAGTTDDMART